MQVKILVPQRVREYWDKYGGCEYAANRLLQEVEWQNLPQTMTPGERKTKMLIEVTDETYLQVRDIFGSRSNNISLSRLLTLYCDMGYAEENHWPVTTRQIDRSYQWTKTKENTLQNIKKLLVTCDNVPALTKAFELIKEVNYRE